MSGFAYKLKYTTVMTPMSMAIDDEAAGKSVGKILGVVAAIAIPFAAPAVFGAIAGSGILGAGLATAAASGTMGAITSIVGSSVVGGIMSAGVAYAGGARGGDVWRAAGIGAVSGGLSQASGLGHVFNGTNTTTAAGVNAVGGTGPVSLAPTTAGTIAADGTGIVAATTNAATNSGGLLSQMSRIFTGNSPINRIGMALTNAIINGNSQSEIDALVEQQRAALQGLNAQEQAAYAQRMNAAQQVLAAANQMDPAWLARVRMADVAGVEANEYRQAMRNIATRQGGSLDTGQRKAYERAASLHTGRSKALAYNEGWGQGVQGQAQLFGQAAGLFTGPNFGPWQADTELLLGQARAHQQANRNTAAGFWGALGETDYRQPTSPAPVDDNQDPFAGGLSNPFGNGGQ